MSNLHIPSTGSTGSANSGTTIGSTSHPGGDTDGLGVIKLKYKYKKTLNMTCLY